MSDYRYYSTKLYKDLGSVAYRQWRADSHCKLLHGYSMSFYFEFASNELDVRNWVVDFGGLKPLKELLESFFDHTLLVAQDDPAKETFLGLAKLGLAKVVEVEATGCEALSDWLYRYINDGFLRDLTGADGRVFCTEVRISETERNSAGRRGTKELWDLDCAIDRVHL